MEQVIPVLLAIAAIAIGYYIGYLVQRRKLDELEEQIADAQEEVTFCKRDAETKLKAAVSKAKQAEAGAKDNSGLQGERDKLAGEVSDLRAKLQKAEEAWVGSSEEMEEERRSSEAVTEQLVQAQGALSAAHQQLASVEDELRQAQTDNAALQQQAAEGGDAAPPATDDAQAAELFKGVGNDLNKALEVLASSGEQQVAVLADTTGVDVAWAGNRELKDGLAASAQEVQKLAKTLHELVPFASMTGFQLADGESTIIAGRNIDCGGDALVLATLGPKEPAEAMFKGAEASVKEILG